MKRRRLSGYPAYDRPVRADLLHLKLYHLTRLPTSNAPLATLQNAVQMANDTLDEEARWRQLMHASPHTPERQLWEELEHRNPPPDQLRVQALPTVFDSVVNLHEALLPDIIKTIGARATRDYLRGLCGSVGPFRSYASAKLISIDKDILAQYRVQAAQHRQNRQWPQARAAYQLIISEYPNSDAAREAQENLRKVVIAQYSDEAQAALAARNFEAARAAYRRIKIEFAGSDEAQWADGELRKIVPVAVAFYKAEGDKVYQPGKQFGAPQSKAREFYQKMYDEDPNGPQADYAFFSLSKALGTEGRMQEAVSQLEQFTARFPDSPLRSQAALTLGLLYANQNLRHYDKAIKWLQDVAENSQDAQAAPEALFHLAFLYAWRDDFKSGLPCLERLITNFPASPRAKWAKPWAVRFKQKIETGGKWP